MRAFVLSHYGGPQFTQFEDVPLPKPGPREVLVRVHAAGLNPVDYKTRQGKLRAVQSYRLPAIMGHELAGVVEECGPDVAAFAPGDRVFARVPNGQMGAFAEFVTVSEVVLAKMPVCLDFVAAAAVPLAGLTALQALRNEMRLQSGDHVLITGGAGGVGSFAIQIAKSLGARVTTTASPRGRAVVERLGADSIVDYTKEAIGDHVYEVDGVFDLIGGKTLDQAFGVIKPEGTVVSVVAGPEPETATKDLGGGRLLATLFWFASLGLRWKARRRGARYRFLFMRPSGLELSELAEMIEAGLVVPIIDKIFAFNDIAAALAYLETGRAKGKVVVKMVD